MDWLTRIFRPLDRLLAGLNRLLPEGIVAKALLWLVVVAIVSATIWVLVQSARGRSWRWPLGRTAVNESMAAEWTPEPERARALLHQADALAQNGRYAEAARLLLRHSIGDIARRRPRLVEPALTSRDIAGAPDLPERARAAFAPIVASVERSLFGGRPMACEAWDECRRCYAEFALSKAWHE